MENPDRNIAYVPCNLCGSGDCVVDEHASGKIRAQEPAKVVRCRACGLMYTNPRTLHSQSEYYNERYYREHVEKCGVAGGSERLADYLRERIMHIERIGRKGRLLEIGSAFGLFLKYAHDRGWVTKGVEISPWASEFSRGKFGLDIVNRPFEKTSFSGESFDVVHMNHVLEHMYDPMKSLKLVHRLLAGNGLLVLEVPNEFNRFSDLARKIGRRLGFHVRPEPYAVASPHLYFFTAESLLKMLEKAGFSVRSIATEQRGITYYSRVPGGKYLYRGWYFLEEKLKMGRFIVVYAEKRL